MIPEAREVHLSRKDRKVLEACCRSPMTLQRDLKRARIVLLAAAGRSTRSIAKEVGVQPRIVSLWRHRYGDHVPRDNQGETRIASPELLPKLWPLPHLICSRQNNLGSGDEEGKHGDASGI